MTPEQFKQALASDDPELRRQATIALVDYRGAAGPLLLKALGDGSWRVREEAVRVGAIMAGSVDISEELVAAICQGDNVGLRNSALALLGALGPRVHEVLTRALSAVDDDARKFVLEALAAAGGPGVVTLLVDHLHSGDPNMVAAALDALAVVGGPEGEQALRSVLTWDDAFQRMAAMDALNRIEAVVPWQELSRLLGDRLVFRVALPALGRCRDARAVAPLVAALSETSLRVAGDAAAALSMLVDSVDGLQPDVAREAQGLDASARARLAGLDEHHSIDARRGAALALCLARDPRGLDAAMQLQSLAGGLPPAILDALYAWGDEAVDALLEAHVHVTTPRSAPALDLAATIAAQGGAGSGRAPLLSRLRAELRRGLYGTDPELRLVAARAMGPFAEGADAVPLVEAALKQDEELSQACGEALIMLSERAPEPVREALSQVELAGPGLDAVVSLMVALEGDRALGRLQAALLSDDVPTRCAALAGLSALGDGRAADLIGLALTDASLEVQLAAAEALGSVREERGVPALLLCLDGSPPELCAAVAHALGETGSARAVSPLVKLMGRSADNPAVQVAALASLRRLAAPGLREVLVEALSARDSEVVKQALSALHDLGDASFPHLRAALSDPRWDVRQLAVRLLAESGHPDAHGCLSARVDQEQDEMVKDALVHAVARLRGDA